MEWGTKPTNELIDYHLYNGKRLLDWCSIGLGPFGETVNKYKDISVTLLGFYKRTKDIDGYLPLPDTALGNANIARSTVLHDIVFHVGPVETPFQSINHLVTP